MEIISRKAAKNAGLSRYFTGKLCRRGHLSPRNVTSCICLECQREDYRNGGSVTKKHYYEQNRESLLKKQRVRDYARLEEIQQYQKEYRERTTESRLEYHRDYYDKNSERWKARSREYYIQNKSYYLEYNHQYYDENKDALKMRQREYYKVNQDKILTNKKEYYKANQKDFIARNAKRRAYKRNAMPSWANMSVINKVYENATGEIHHIVPLQACSDVVCGLHCEANLIELTKEQHNKLHSDYHLLKSSWNWNIGDFLRLL